MLPRITIEGNLASDPELRFIASGKALATFTVVASNRRRNDQGAWEETDTSFFRCVCFGQIAENLVNSASKGSKLLVHGQIKQRSWETDSGEKRSAWEVVADDVAVSVRFAEARTQKVERTATQTNEDPWAGKPKAVPGNADPWAAFGDQEQKSDPPF